MKSVRRKVIAGIATAGAALALLPLFAAWEAHVVNVTAKIENAMEASTYSLDFGTVFPQGVHDKTFDLALSESFLLEDRIDDVEYVLRQKPKCQRNDNADTSLPPFGQVTEDEQNPNIFVCKDPVNYHLMPFLCPYLSKAEITNEDNLGNNVGENDMEVPGGFPGHAGPLAAFHGPILLAPAPGGWDLQTTLAYQIFGRLARSEQDTLDTWNIDLRVPCFTEDQCAQDWADFFLANGGEANGHTAEDAPDYIQPAENESKLFGCDLWVEVFGISVCDPGEHTVVSDTTNTVVGDEDGIPELINPVPGAWTANIPGASWIWEQNPVQAPVAGETYTFVKSFNVVGTVVSSSIQVAADNTYSVKINNTVVCSSADANNFTLATQDLCVVNNLVTGNNTIEITVTNSASNPDPNINPAGLLYKLTYVEVCDN